MTLSLHTMAESKSHNRTEGLSHSGLWDILGRLPFARTDRPKRTDSHLCKWKGQGRSVRLLTRSLRGIHVRAHINNMADLATKLSKIPPTLLRDFLSPEEEDTLFLNNLEEELAFSSVDSIFSRRKLRTSSNSRFLAIIWMASGATVTSG